MSRAIAAVCERLPGVALGRRLFVRALWVWLLGRLVVQAVSRLPAGESLGAPISLTFPAMVGVAAVVAALGLVDVARRNERLLLANLGIRLYVVAAIGVFAALTGEVILRLAMGPAA